MKHRSLQQLSPRDRPAYPLGEAARYARVAPATLRSWVLGRPYKTARGEKHWPALISVADPSRMLLSFNNLVEAHVLRALRTKHGTPISAIRTALTYAQRELGVDRLFMSKALSTSAKDLFLDHYGELINLSKSGQLAIRGVLQAHLERVEWDDADLPRRLFPFLTSDDGHGARHITIDPAIGFGRPILSRTGVSTLVVASRIDAGETIEDVAADYGVTEDELTEAVIYERAA